MTTLQLQIPDDLAERLRSHQDELVTLLELGLETHLAREEHGRLRERIPQALEESDLVTMPQSRSPDQSQRRHAPVPTRGQPLSEIVIEQRGSL